jgi:hypothetical protein
MNKISKIYLNDQPQIESIDIASFLALDSDSPRRRGVTLKTLIQKMN